MDALEELFVGAEVDGVSGFVNLMRMKFEYFKSIQPKLIEQVDMRTEGSLNGFREELFDKLYTFFNRYFCESGSIYFRHLPVFARTYESVYGDGEDVTLAWKTRMLYYVKSDVLIRSMPVKIDESRPPYSSKSYYFDASEIEHGKNNEKKEFVFKFMKVVKTAAAEVTHIQVTYSKNGSKTSVEGITKGARSGKPSVTLSANDVEKAIRVFKRQTEADYFINKDAGSFFREQFDLWMFQYLYREESVFTQKRLTQLQAIRDTAYEIIDFISQFEDELRRVWEKPKFVIGTNYVLTLDKLSSGLLRRIAEHDGIEEQIKEWRELNFVGEDFSPDVLVRSDEVVQIGNGLNGEYLFLPLDTKHFEDIKLEMLEELGDLDAMLDGEIIRSENWQALNSMRRRYADQIDCIHIDPPYNTKTSGFLYKNEYNHASWLTMMENRIEIAMKLMNDSGVFLCHIDEHEYERLHLLLDKLGLRDAGTVIWNKRIPVSGGKGIAKQHEYICWRTKLDQSFFGRSQNLQLILDKADELISKHGGVNDKVRKEFTKWVNSQSEFTGGENAYRNIDDDQNVYRMVSLSAPEQRTDPKFHVPLLHPETRKPCPVPPSGFSRTPATLNDMMERGEILFGKDETTQPQQKLILTSESKAASSVIRDGRRGKYDLDKLGLPNFPYCHPSGFYSDLLDSAMDSNSGVVLDYFAGSGTSGQAVISLNRTDGGNRKYVLVEMGEYFDPILIPRLKKVIFSDEWKKGKPAPSSGSSHFFKYYSLEQYETVLRHTRYKDSEQLSLDSQKSPFQQYVFFGDDKLGHLIDTSQADAVDINLHELFPDIDIASSLANVVGKHVRRITEDAVTFSDGSVEKINPATMTDEEKLHFISLIKPYLWWGDDD